MKHSITIVIPTRNEAANLQGCLKALNGSLAAVWVVDSGSRDGTREIAADSGAEVVDFEWDGRFPKKREWVLRHREFATPWVWFMDADERVNRRLLREVARWLDDDGCAAMSIPLRRWWGRQPLRFARRPRKTALLRVGRAEHVPFPDDHWSPKDVETFERVKVDGRLVKIRACLEQCNARGIEHRLEKLRHDVQWESCRCWWLRSSRREVWEQLTPEEAARYRWLDAPWAGWEIWFQDYLLGGGFLDGPAGWQHHRLLWRLRREVRQRMRLRK